MKTKSIILLITLCAVITLSFTFATQSGKTKAKKEVAAKSTDSEPAGGFVSEDKF